VKAIIRLLARVFAIKLVIDRFKARRGEKEQDSHAVVAARRRELDALRDSAQPRTTSESRIEETPVPVQTGRGPGPDSPLELDAPDWKQTLKRTLKEIKADRVTLIAAGMAYYFFLALFPAIIAAIGVMDLVGTSTQWLIDWIRTSLPGGAGEVVVDALASNPDPAQNASLIAAITGIALALWSASSGFVALQSGLNVAYDIPEDRKFVGKRVLALVLILATGLLGGVPSPFFTFGESTIFTVIGWILTIASVVVLFAVFYYLGPKRESPRWVWVSPGGLVGAFIWLVSSAAFGIYITEFSSYGKTYGSLAGVIVLILWLYLTSISILVGGELNAELERQSAINEGTTSAPEDPR
jgi:membrane protein